MTRPTLVQFLACTALLAAPAAAQQRTELPRADRVFASQPATVFTAGKADGAEWETFALIAAVDFDADDNLYILDAQSQRVTVLDRAGKLVRQFGRKGGGPGELQFPMALAVTADSTIVIADMGKQAYLRFRRDGTFISSVAFPSGQRLSPQLTLRAHPSSGIILETRATPDMAELEKSVTAGQRFNMNFGTHILAHPLRDGVTPTKLFDQPPPTATRPIKMDTPAGAMQMTMPAQIHFAPQLHWSVLTDGGIAVSNVAEYSVKLVGATGATTRIITRPIQPRPVTRAERDSVTKEMKKSLEERANIPGLRDIPPEARAMMDNVMKQMTAEPEFAEVHPVIHGLGTDRDGRLWIARSGSRREDSLVDVVAADGRYIGTARNVAIPSAFSRSGRIAFIDYDDDGVPTVVVKQIPADWR